MSFWPSAFCLACLRVSWDWKFLSVSLIPDLNLVALVSSYSAAVSKLLASLPLRLGRPVLIKSAAAAAILTYEAIESVSSRALAYAKMVLALTSSTSSYSYMAAFWALNSSTNSNWLFTFRFSFYTAAKFFYHCLIFAYSLSSVKYKSLWTLRGTDETGFMKQSAVNKMAAPTPNVEKNLICIFLIWAY